MKSIALIPARYAATRFPAKLMQPLGGKSVILRTYENTVATLLFDEVIVVTDSDIIFREIISNGGYAVMSHGLYESGSDRIAAAATDLDTDVIINVQGDEPFVKMEPLRNLLAVFEADPHHQVAVASLMHEIKNPGLISDPNAVKVVVDTHQFALFFSRSAIPFHRNLLTKPVYYKHIGIYGYRKKALMDFSQLTRSPLEAAEQLEQLRYLENGYRIRMVLTDEAPVSIDTPEDLEKARRFIGTS